EEEQQQMDGKSIGMGFVLGTVVGGAVALLYAPRPGSETRGILKTKAEHTAEEALEIAEHAKDIATERVKKAKSAAEAARREAESQGGAQG
ncbi:MAG: YtxH domain-containing protein, partial [Chloroflexota bacterium]